MKKTIRDFDINNKKVIIRCDFNVPIKNGIILDDNRIKESLKTIKYALEKRAKVILLSHLGRVKSEEDKKKNTLLPVCKRLSELLDKKVLFSKDTRGVVLEEMIKNMKPSDAILIENTRYEDFPNKYESSNDDKLANYWASLADVFINDAFGTIHRSHASNVGIASYLPSGIGFLVEKEINKLNLILDSKERPFVVIMGGAKINDKIPVIDNLINKADYILMGGGIANTFLKAKGLDIGLSLYDEESISYCKKVLSCYEKKIILPVDALLGKKTDVSEKAVYYDFSTKIGDYKIFDIGLNTVQAYAQILKKAKIVFWNGPLGVTELENFSNSTKNICQILKESKAKVIVGGGDSASAVIKLGFKDSFYHISTGGGASLEFLEGKELPGLKVINNR